LSTAPCPLLPQQDGRSPEGRVATAAFVGLPCCCQQPPPPHPSNPCILAVIPPHRCWASSSAAAASNSTAHCCRHPYHHRHRHQTPSPATTCSFLPQPPPSAVGGDVLWQQLGLMAFNGQGNGHRQGSDKATAAKMAIDSGCSRWQRLAVFNSGDGRRGRWRWWLTKTAFDGDIG
jgi:hypothetical protein